MGVIRIHDPKTGEVKRDIRDHSKRINTLQWNAEKTLLITGSADFTSKLFDVATWRCLRTFETEVPVNAAAISPIKEHVFVAGGQEARDVTTTNVRTGKFETKLFHMVFGDEFGSVKGHFGPVNTLALHPDGTGFTSGSEDGYIRVHTFDKDYFSQRALPGLDKVPSKLFRNSNKIQNVDYFLNKITHSFIVNFFSISLSYVYLLGYQGTECHL
jgi:translation initiation factor 3 subunit I